LNCNPVAKYLQTRKLFVNSFFSLFSYAEETVKAKWKNLRDTFRKEFKKVPQSHSGDGGEQAPRYVGTWPHFGAMLFLQFVIARRLAKGNAEDPEVSKMSAAAANEHNESAQVKEEVVIYESDSETFQSFQLNASSYQSVPSSQPTTSGTNETCDKTRNTKVTILQSNSKLQGELQQLPNSLPDATGPTDEIKISSAASKKRKGQPTMSSVNFDKELSDIESKKPPLLQGQSDEDDDDMHFFKSLIPHVKQLPSINKLYFRSQVQNVLAHELSKIQSSLHLPPPATSCQQSPSNSLSPTP
jgi:hypothetical protein